MKITRAGQNVVIEAPPGAGKTSAIAIAALQLVDEDKRQPQVLIVVPMREEAQQICTLLNKLAAHTHIACIVTVGGSDIRENVAALRQGAHIVVGTPHRVNSLIKGKGRGGALRELSLRYLRPLTFFYRNIGTAPICALRRQCAVVARVESALERLPRRHRAADV